MHLPDGLLPAPVLIGGYGVSGLVTWYCLRQINHQPDPRASIPKASLLTAAFFVASSIYIPVPPASVHLVLNGLLGVMLGYFAFPAILIGLFLQALVIGHGGLTTLGINGAMLGIPALISYYLFQLRYPLQRLLPQRPATALCAFFGGALGVGLSILIFVGLVITNLPTGLDTGAERQAVLVMTIAHIPLMMVEGIFTAMLVLFLQRVRPQLIEG